MKLVLVNLWKEDTSTPPMGIAYISSYIKKYSDIDTCIVDAIDGKDPIIKIKQENPDVIGVTSLTYNFEDAKSFATTIKNELDLPVVVGGHHISALPHTLPKCFDVGVIGEGEQTMLELVKLYEKYGKFPINELKKVNGIVFHKDDQCIITNPRQLIEPLDNIPFPDRDLLPMDIYLKPRPYVLGRFTSLSHILTSRGCPYRCVFCSSAHFWKRTRFHSAKYVVEEIKLLIEKYKVKVIDIIDDLFIAHRPRLRELAKLIKEEKINEQVEFSCNCRANLINAEICKLLKEMNFTYLSFGFESGSNRVLGFLKRNTVTVEDGIRAIRICKNFGLNVGGSVMLGTPGETEQDIKDTCDFIKNNPLDIVGVWITTPLPGTELWEIAKKDGFVSENMDWKKLFIEPTKNLEGNTYINKEIDKEIFLRLLSMVKMEANIKNYRYSKLTLGKLFRNLKYPSKIKGYLISKILSKVRMLFR